jgi:hypothetical protein
MPYVSEHLLKRIEREEESRIIREYHGALAARGVLSNPDRLWLRRFRPLLRTAGGVLVGILIGTFAVFFTFVILNLVLHAGAL